jgi:DNA-binding response OmpR family regulator
MHTILIVEDDTFLLDMYAVKFKESGFTVDTSQSVEDALAKLRKGATFDAVLLDMVMPGLTGLDLLKTMRAESLGGTPKMIVLSNQGEKSDIEDAMAAGATGYIVKANVIPSEVVARVKEYLGGDK